MRGDLYSGWLTLAGDFPPTLNKEADPVKLAPNESPDAYGIDPEEEGLLAAGTAATGTTRAAVTKTIATATWYWYYNRAWKATTTTLDVGAPDYDTIYFRQAGAGPFTTDANIISYMPALGDSMWVGTLTGSHLIRNATDQRGFFELGPFSQEMLVPASTCALTLDGFPIAFNANGVFSWDGRKVTELTRKIRNNLGAFAYSAAGTDTVKADYAKKWIVGQDATVGKFVIDTETGKLFDYSTSGFRFTTRTLAQTQGYAPFQVGGIAFVYEASARGEIEWQTKSEDGSWYTERKLVVPYEEGSFTRMEAELRNPILSARRFAVRLTALSSTIKIREIQITVQGLAQSSSTE